MKKTFYSIFIILILLSCNQTTKKKTPEIEIYLTEKRIESTQGLEINETNIDSLGYRRLEKRFDFNIVRLDTINNELIFAGDFKANKADLSTKPFLEKERILEFNPKTGFLRVDSIGAKRISKLNPSNGYGHQFVLTVNNRPELFGYFFSYPFSFYCHTYNYDYVRTSIKTDFELNYGVEMKAVDLEKDNYQLFSILKNNGK